MQSFLRCKTPPINHIFFHTSFLPGFLRMLFLVLVITRPRHSSVQEISFRFIFYPSSHHISSSDILIRRIGFVHLYEDNLQSKKLPHGLSSSTKSLSHAANKLPRSLSPKTISRTRTRKRYPHITWQRLDKRKSTVHCCCAWHSHHSHLVVDSTAYSGWKMWVSPGTKTPILSWCQKPTSLSTMKTK